MLLSSLRAFARVFAVLCVAAMVVVVSSIGAQAQSPNDIFVCNQGSGNVQYDYDDLGRLVRVCYPDAGVGYTYSYDAAGNRTEHQIQDSLGNLIRLWNTNVFEGGVLSFGVWRVGAATHDITVTYETYVPTEVEPGTTSATPTTDYTVKSGTVTIPASNDGQVAYIHVPTVEDTIEEGAEELVYIRLIEATGGVIDPDKQERIGRIKDDDGSNVAFHVRGASVNEKSGSITFQVLKIGAAGGDTSVDFSVVGGDATPGVDYVDPGVVTVEFDKDEQLQKVTFSLVDDDIYELGETIEVALSNPTGGDNPTLITDPSVGQSRATGTINDLDDLPSVLVSRTSIKEGDSGDTGQLLNFTVWTDKKHTNRITGKVTLCVNAEDLQAYFAAHPECNGFSQQASANEDDIVGGTVTKDISFGSSPAVESSADFAITVASDNDNTEGTEQAVLVLHDISGAQVDQVRGSAFVNIRNDDPAVSSASIFNFGPVAPVDASEPLTFMVKRWGSLSGSKDIEYDLSSQTSTFTTPEGKEYPQKFRPAVEGTHFPVGGAKGTVHFDNGQSTAYFTVETIATGFSGAYNGGVQLAVEITEVPAGDEVTERVRFGWINDAAIPELNAQNNVTADEDGGSSGGGSGNTSDTATKMAFPVTLSRPVAYQTQVQYHTTMGGTASLDDYTPVSGILTFEPGETEKTISIPITADVLDEPDETIKLYVERQVVDTEVPIEPIIVTGTIISEATDACARMLSNKGSLTAGEGVGGITAKSASSTGAGNVCSTSTAMAGTMMAAMSGGGGLDMTPHDFTVEIIPGSADEGKDFEARTITVTLNDLDSELTVPAEIIDDLVNEGAEYFTLRATANTPGDIVDGDKVIYIEDDDPGPDFSISDTEIDENSLAVFTISKVGSTDLTSSVTYQTVDGTATAHDDYSPISGILTFAPEETEKTLVISTADDNSFEHTETFTLELSLPSHGTAIEKAVGTATIADDDETPTFSITDATADEGDELTFKVLLSRPSAFEHAVHIATQDHTAYQSVDYQQLEADLVFAPGETEHTITIATINNDIVDTNPRTMKISLSNPTNGAKLGDQFGKGYIEEVVVDLGYHIHFSDTEIGTGLSLSSDKLTVTAVGSSAAVFVNTGPISAGKWYWEMQPHSSGSDYPHGGIAPSSASPTAQPFYYTAGATHFMIGTVARAYHKGTGAGATEYTWGSPTSASYIAYLLDMDNRTLTIKVNGASATSISNLPTSVVPTVASTKWTTTSYSVTGRFDTTSFSGTLPAGYQALAEFDNGNIPSPIPDDSAAVSLSVGDVEQDEGDDFVFTVSASGTSTEAVEVSYSLVADTAVAVSDYLDATGTLTFAPGETVKTIVVQSVEDAVEESMESFSVQLALVSGDAALVKDTGTGSILDDDEAPDFSILSDSYTALDSKPVKIAISKSIVTGNDYSLSYTTVDGTATAGTNYTAASGTITFTSEEMVKWITLDIGNGDDISFDLQISNPTGGASIDNSETTITLDSSIVLTEGSTTYDMKLDSNSIYKVEAGDTLTVSMAAGGGGRKYTNSGTIAGGGSGSFELVAGQDFYLRTRVGKKGKNSSTYQDALADINGGGSSHYNNAGQGGGATSLIMSSDGANWMPVAIVGAGGGEGYSYAGGGGGGFNTEGADGSHSSYAGKAGTLLAGGAGGVYSSYAGGTGGTPGLSGGVSSYTYAGSGGQGNEEFGIGGGGGGDHYYGGGGGGGYYGGGGGSYYSGGGGGSGFFDEAAISAISGATPTILTTSNGSNAADGYVTFDYTPVPKAVYLDVADASAVEGQDIIFTVTATGTSSEPVVVNYSTADGTAVAGTDYTATSGTLTFAPGETSKTITVLGTSDNQLDDDNKSFTLYLGITSGDVGLNNSSVTGTVLDDEFVSQDLAHGITVFNVHTNSDDIYKVSANTAVTIALGGGAGGYSNGESPTLWGAAGGSGRFTLVVNNPVYLRMRVGKPGGSYKSYSSALYSDNGGGVGGSNSHGGQGGGATSIIMSSDGMNWIPVAIVGGGGGSSRSYASAGKGGGLNQVGLDGRNASGGGKGATLAAPGSGGSGGGGSGGAAGADGQSSTNTYGGLTGAGDVEFSIGGGGAGGSNNSNNAGGGGGGYYGGGGGYEWSGPGGGGSGYFDATAIESIAGNAPTIEYNATGGNQSNGYVNITLSQN